VNRKFKPRLPQASGGFRN